MDIPKGQQFTFGYLEVPENREVPDGKWLRLPVYIFKSRSENPAPDPIIYTVGGPGATTMPSAAYMQYYRYLDHRDFILFEQRGTRYAQPSLDCPEWGEAMASALSPFYDDWQRDSILTHAADACQERLRAEGNDLNQYHTRAIAQDMADLVQVLKLDSFNLLTISYSTKIAQVMMRDHPTGLRSVVMDSPLPLEANWGEESNDNLIAGYRKIFAACREDSACRAAYGNLENRFFDALERFTHAPLRMEVEYEGEMIPVFLKGKDLIQLFPIDDRDNIPRLLARINCFVGEDYTDLRKQVAEVLAGRYTGEGMGMRLSVWCAEETPFQDPGEVQRAKDRFAAIKGLDPQLFGTAICEAWGVKAMPQQENEPVQSDIPVLIISGEFDEITPARWGKQMMGQLPNSQQLVFPGWHHTPTTYWSDPCGMEAASSFFQRPNQAVKVPCFDMLERPALLPKTE